MYHMTPLSHDFILKVKVQFMAMKLFVYVIGANIVYIKSDFYRIFFMYHL